MTNCKEIAPTPEKRTVFDVRINISDCKIYRNQIVKELRNITWRFGEQLADMIEKG